MQTNRSTALSSEAEQELAAALKPAGRTLQVERGGRLFHAGEAAKGVYVISDGMARVSLPGGKGCELASRTVSAGAVLGLHSALCAAEQQFEVEALEPLGAVFVETSAVHEVFRSHPELCLKAMQLMCDELDRMGSKPQPDSNCDSQSCSLHGVCQSCRTN